MEDVQATEVFIPLQKTSSTLKFEFSSLLWVFFGPPESGSVFPARIRIRIPSADPDPADQNECGSGSATLTLRIV
jgi:hypothetical protein